MRLLPIAIAAATVCLLAATAWPRTPGDGATTAPAPPAAATEKGTEKGTEQPADAPRYPELTAVIVTSRGEMRARLFPNEVPRIVANFVNLAGRKYYDGMAFHSVARGFQVHTGDPTGTGNGGPGYTVEPQYSGKVLFDEAGVLSMWTTSKRVGSQFFITLRPNERKLNLNQAAFGKLTAGLEVAEAIQKGDALEEVRVEGDATLLLQDFAPEIAGWNATLDQRSRTKSGGDQERRRDRTGED
ncbi:MAG: peptidylprolyl isomerase [Phycisphaerales bacterium]|nr:peptidylprolyl isomerase [Phycisphaerales bacterium]